jgi:hypothetical protein
MSDHHDGPLKAIDGYARTVQELLDEDRFVTDPLQLEHVLARGPVRERIADLKGARLQTRHPTRSPLAHEDRRS